MAMFFSPQLHKRLTDELAKNVHRPWIFDESVTFSETKRMINERIARSFGIPETMLHSELSTHLIKPKIHVPASIFDGVELDVIA